MERSLATIAKHLTFDSAHYLLNPAMTRAKNIETFHKCCFYKEDGSNEAHGHTYHLEVYITGFISEDTGYVIDFKDLKKILKEGVVERLDHRLINDIPWFDENKKLATVENILHYVWEEIQPAVDRLRPNEAWLYKIKMYETPDSFATLDRKQWEREQQVSRDKNEMKAEETIEIQTPHNLIIGGCCCSHHIVDGPIKGDAH